MKTIDDLGGEVTGKVVLVRSDLNVPIEGGTILDDGRIRASVPTIKKLAAAGARVVVVAHLGRPDGTVKSEFSLYPVAARLGELLGQAVSFATDTVGDSATSVVAGLANGQVAVLENVRFNAAETSKSDAERAAFADQLAGLADVFVSDGFGVVHRRQASVFDVARRLDSAAGELVQAELNVLRRLTNDPQRPYTVVLGGSKVSDKIGVIDNLLQLADSLLIGGGMVFTFLKAQGYEVGTSLLEADQVQTAQRYLAEAERCGVNLLLPTDVVVAPALADARATVVDADQIPADQMGLDIGPDSARRFATEISRSATVFWNGPMGVYEMPSFADGTRTVAEALTQVDGLSVVGGGDSAAAIRQLGFNDDDFSHISTGGGASLEYLEGAELPGLTVLNETR